MQQNTSSLYGLLSLEFPHHFEILTLKNDVLQYHYLVLQKPKMVIAE